MFLIFGGENISTSGGLLAQGLGYPDCGQRGVHDLENGLLKTIKPNDKCVLPHIR